MKALLNIFLLLFPLFVFANRNDSDSLGVISGIVFSLDGQPAEYVTVIIKNTLRGAITDNKGKFEIKKIKVGHYILSVSLSGYASTEINVEVKQNETAFLKIQLQVTYAELMDVIVKAGTELNYVETKTSEFLRLNLPLIEVPQNIVVVPHQILADQGLLSMTEAIRNVSGVEKTYGGLNDYSLIIRGSDATWNVFRNGIGGYWWNQQEDVAMLEKIEFVKGPAGFMMNEAEPGGIVNTVTKQPVKERITNINVAFGSYAMMRFTVDLGGGFSKKSKFSYRFNGGIHSQNRAFQYSTASRYFICAAVKYDINKKTCLTAEYNWVKGKTFGNNTDLPSINGKIFALPANFAAADANTDRLIARDRYYRIHFNHAFNDNWQLNAQLAYVNGIWGGYTLRADGDVPISNDTLYRASVFDDWRNFSKVAQLSLDGKFYSGHKIEHKVLLGVDYHDGGLTDDWGWTSGEKKYGLYIPDPQYYVSRDSLRNFEINVHDKLGFTYVALYLHDHIKIAGKLIVTLASHLTHATLYAAPDDAPDYQRNNTYNVLAPRAGLTWLFSNDISAYAMYDQSFWPQIGENIERKPFKPLTGYDIETGMKAYFFKKKLNLNFSVFNIVKNNTLSGDPINPGLLIQTGQVTSKGIDVDVTGNITASLIVNANYEYVDAKITRDSAGMTGLKILGTPDNYGNLWLKYNLLKGLMKNISFAMGYQYMGKRSALWNWSPGDAINYLPVYNLFDAALSYHNDKFNISLNVYNITNINYATIGYFNSSTNEWRYTPGEPTNFRLSFGVNLQHHRKDQKEAAVVAGPFLNEQATRKE